MLKIGMIIGLIVVVYLVFLLPTPFQDLNWVKIPLNPAQYYLPVFRASFDFYEDIAEIENYELFLMEKSLVYVFDNSTANYFSLESAGGTPIHYYSFVKTNGEYGLISVWNCSRSFYMTEGSAKDQYSFESMKTMIQGYVCLQ
ncbi:MAG: hypothetical protein PHW96_02915 [Candidatus Nanoarchaeia archaeon]|nr:hypothetical protein [Candidatus Nanoarchaeia archaeon]